MIVTLSRYDWGASPLWPTLGAEANPEQFFGLMLHHTVTGYVPTASADEVAEHARYLQRVRAADLGPEVPYHYCLGEHPDPYSAWIVEGRGRRRTGAHATGHNSTRYGVALLGDYSTRPMTPGMVTAFRQLAAELLAHDPNPAPTLAHRQVYATACPGGAAMEQLALLQPPFNPSPMEGQSMTISEADRDTLGLTFTESRDYDEEGRFTTTAPQPIAQLAAWAHIEAQLAALAADKAAEQATMAAIAAEQANASVQALHEHLVSTSRPMPAPLGEMTAELLADALTIALRRIFTAS